MIMISYAPGPKADYAKVMFPTIARSYDRLTHLLTFALDRRWRRWATGKTGLCAGGRVLDLATGTGAMAMLLASQVAPNGMVVGIDLCPEMLAVAREKVRETPMERVVYFLATDASEGFPFPSSAFDCVTMSLALRYFDVRETLREMIRVVRPGGRVVILDFASPVSRWARPGYRLWAFGLMPALGGLLARSRRVYELLMFLPRSVAHFYSREVMERLMKDLDLADIRVLNHTFGVVALYMGVKKR